MLAHVLTDNPAPFRGSRRRRVESRRGRAADDVITFRHLVAARLEMTPMTHLPMLDWPANLFTDAGSEIAA